MKINTEKFKQIAIASYLANDEKRTVFLDTETTGVASDDEVIELAILDNKKNVLFHKMFEPGKEINPFASKVSGITDAMVKGCPKFSEYIEEIKQILYGKRVVGWNIAFDDKLMKQTAEKQHIEFDSENYESVDLMIMAGYYFNTCGEFLKQNEVMHAFNIGHDEKHRAVDDVADMIDVLRCMANEDEKPKDIFECIPDKKKEKIINKRNNNRKVSSEPRKKEPQIKEERYMRYVRVYNDTHDVNKTADEFGVQKATVVFNLLKAGLDGKIAGIRFSDGEKLAKAIEFNREKNISLLEDVQKVCHRIGYRTFCTQMHVRGLEFEDLCQAAYDTQTKTGA